MAGAQLAKIDAKTGQPIVYFQDSPSECASSIDIHQKTGTAWVTVRRSGAAGSKNKLLAFSGDGATKVSVDLGGEVPDHPKIPFHVSVNQNDGSVLVTLFRNSVRRYSADGELKTEKMTWALAAEADAASDDVWVATRQAVVRMSPDGKVLKEVKHKSGTSQAWMVGF